MQHKVKQDTLADAICQHFKTRKLHRRMRQADIPLLCIFLWQHYILVYSESSSSGKRWYWYLP